MDDCPKIGMLWKLDGGRMMQKRKVVWGLCSGLGGWEEAFAQSDWVVIRIEINPDLEYVPFTRIWDIHKWMDWIDQLPHPDLIVAGPPCQEFSTADWRKDRADRLANPEKYPELLQAIENVKTCLDIIDYIKPTWWLLENVKGAIPYFKKFIPRLKPHRQAVGNKQSPQFYLWGQFPYIIMKPGWKHFKTEARDPQIRALIPFELSFELKRAIETHVRIDRWS